MRSVLFAGLVILAFTALIVSGPDSPSAAQAQGPSYVGTARCATCHGELAKRWSRTLHSKMVRPATSAEIHGNLSAPNAPRLSEFEFVYVLGGWYKEERYVIARGGELLTTPNEWNHVLKTYSIRRTATGDLEFSNWRTACVGCHTTGYNPQTRAWAELNIGCESCHGPGSAHAGAPAKANIIIDRTAEACGSCHIRGADNATRFGFPTAYRLGRPETLLSTFTPIPMTDAASVFPDQFTSNRHRQQFIDYSKSKHFTSAKMGCVACHDPHTGTEVAYSQLKKPKATLCNSCHPAQAANFAAHTGHKPFQVTCADCHTPRVIANGTVSTHTFRALLPADTLRLGPRQANSCTYKCHATQTAAWAQQYMVEKRIGR